MTEVWSKNESKLKSTILKCLQSRPQSPASRPAWDLLCVGVSSDTDACNYTEWKRESKQNSIKQKQQHTVELRAVTGLLLPPGLMFVVPSRWTRTFTREPTHSHALDPGLSSPPFGGDRQLYELMQAPEVAAQRLSGATHRARTDLIVHLLHLHLLCLLRPSPRGRSSTDICSSNSAKRISAIGLDGPSLAAHPDELAQRR